MKYICECGKQIYISPRLKRKHEKICKVFKGEVIQTEELIR